MNTVGAVDFLDRKQLIASSHVRTWFTMVIM